MHSVLKTIRPERRSPSRAPTRSPILERFWCGGRARPVRAAEKTAPDPEVPTVDSDAFYAISAHGIPTPKRWNIENGLKGIAALRRDRKKRPQALARNDPAQRRRSGEHSVPVSDQGRDFQKRRASDLSGTNRAAGGHTGVSPRRDGDCRAARALSLRAARIQIRNSWPMCWMATRSVSAPAA
jgi:hypothetical protein